MITAKSSGESLGTEVTTPVPFFIEILNIGNTYTASYTDNGAWT